MEVCEIEDTGSITFEFEISTAWDWGDRGHGYLDYEYVRRNLAGDFWSIIKIDMFSEIDFEE